MIITTTSTSLHIVDRLIQGNVALQSTLQTHTIPHFAKVRSWLVMRLTIIIPGQPNNLPSNIDDYRHADDDIRLPYTENLPDCFLPAI